MSILYIVLIVGVLFYVGLLACLCEIYVRRTQLYTKDGSPVMVDQIAEARRRQLRHEQAIHEAVSPHARPTAPGLVSERKTLSGIAVFPGRRVQ